MKKIKYSMILVVSPGFDHILLQKKNRTAITGKWSIPGGKYEKNELLVKGAMRELYEETGLSIPLFHICNITKKSEIEENTLAELVIYAGIYDEDQILTIPKNGEQLEWINVAAFCDRISPDKSPYNNHPMLYFIVTEAFARCGEIAGNKDR